MSLYLFHPLDAIGKYRIGAVTNNGYRNNYWPYYWTSRSGRRIFMGGRRTSRAYAVNSSSDCFWRHICRGYDQLPSA
ncbi:hypothetical protein D3C77_530170 [compost metagenome]